MKLRAHRMPRRRASGSPPGATGARTPDDRRPGHPCPARVPASQGDRLALGLAADRSPKRANHEVEVAAIGGIAPGDGSEDERLGGVTPVERADHLTPVLPRTVQQGGAGRASGHASSIRTHPDGTRTPVSAQPAHRVEKARDDVPDLAEHSGRASRRGGTSQREMPGTAEARCRSGSGSGRTQPAAERTTSGNEPTAYSGSPTRPSWSMRGARDVRTARGGR